MENRITEYTITFEDIDEEDFITEDKQEADEKFEELKENGELYKVHQYYAKDWVYDEEIGDWEEDYVEVFYTKEANLDEKKDVTMYIDEYYPSRKEAQEAEKVLKKQGKKTKIERHGNEYILWTSYEKVTEEKESDNIKYNVYILTGGDGVYNSRKVDTVDSQDQAVDRVAELNAENGGGAYYIKVVNGKEIEENKKVTESANLSDLKVGMTMFRFYISGATIYLETNKKIRNKADADTIFNIYLQYNKLDSSKYTQEQIDKAKDMILAQMDLITVTNVDDSGFSYTGKYSGGSENVTEMDTINNRLYVIYDSYKITKTNDIKNTNAKSKKCEDVDNTQPQEQDVPVEDPIDTTEELTDGIKKEIYQYAKQQGLDIEKLRKQGIELETLSDTLDKVIGDMVSKTAIEYMDKTGTEIVWDFNVENNDINIIWNNK